MKRCYFRVLLITVISVLFVSACSSREDLSKDNYSKIERLLKAKEIELENGLLNFDKINAASVKLVLDNEKNAASIMLDVSGTIDDTKVDDILQFVSKSVENLEKENIQIKDQDSNTIYPIS